MPGLRSLQCSQRRLVIPDLTNENNIQAPDEAHSATRSQKSGRVASDLSLSEMTALAGELILDGILDRHYMSHQVLVHPLKEGGDRGGFS